MSWWYNRPKVNKHAAAAKTTARLAKKGKTLSPVVLENRTIARTFWGKAWCDNLESYRDFAYRLERGRTYVRGGYVIDLQIESGRITALVQGSSLYEIEVTLSPLSPSAWESFRARVAGRVSNLLDLLQGKLSPEILSEITRKEDGLFPTPSEIQFKCSCPDWASMCKHVAATLYGVGARLDTLPDLFFKLRGVDAGALFADASHQVGTAPVGASMLAEDSLSDIFGVEMAAESSTPPAPAIPPAKTKPPRKKKSVAKTVPKKKKKTPRKKP